MIPTTLSHRVKRIFVSCGSHDWTAECHEGASAASGVFLVCLILLIMYAVVWTRRQTEVKDRGTLSKKHAETKLVQWWSTVIDVGPALSRH